MTFYGYSFSTAKDLDFIRDQFALIFKLTELHMFYWA